MTFLRKASLSLVVIASLALPAGAALAQNRSPEPTRVLDRAAAQRLLANKGLTLQWIDWTTRGHARVQQMRGVWQLRGAQAEAGGPGRLLLEGRIGEIGRDSFTWAPPKTPRKSGSDLIHSFVEGRGDEAGGIVRAFGPFEAAFGAW